MGKKDFSRVCIAGSVYPLLMYLLCSSEEEIDNTCFFFYKDIPSILQRKFKHRIVFNCEIHGRSFLQKVRLILQAFIIRLIAHSRWPFLLTAQLYAQDHFCFSIPLIGKRKYTLLSDAPHVYSILQRICFYEKQIDKKRIVKNKLLNVLLGPLWTGTWGMNCQCESIMLEEKDYISYLDPYLMKEVDFLYCWNAASEFKRNLILNIFDITKEVLYTIQNTSFILLTQPFSGDGIITEEEQIQMYSAILEKYEHSKVLIKVHPRDNVDYRKCFPRTQVFSFPIPTQFLVLLTTSNLRRVVTICSTAASAFNARIVEWIGCKVNKKILDSCGDLRLEDILSEKHIDFIES
jgi:hypothetical protein